MKHSTFIIVIYIAKDAEKHILIILYFLTKLKNIGLTCVKINEKTMYNI
jgi:hypothetical protein